MTADSLFALLETFTHDPLMLGLALALATLVTEDGALVAGSLLVSHDMAAALPIIAWLCAGILGGDLGLYAMGATARRSAWLRHHIPIRRAASFRRWLKDREISVLFFSRLMPGTRLPTYVSYGYLGMNLTRFTVVMAVAALLWVGGMVVFVGEIQALLAPLDGWAATGGAVLAAFLLLYAVPWLIKRRKMLADMPTDSLEDDPHHDRS